MDERILSLVKMSANGVIESITNSLHKLCEDGKEITRSEIQSMIESTVDLSLSENEWHIQQALITAVNEEIDINDLLEEYSQENQ